MFRFCRIITTLAVSASLIFITASPMVTCAYAGEDPSARAFSESVDQLLQLVDKLQAALAKGQPLADLQVALGSSAEEMEANRLLLEEAFLKRESRLQHGGSSARRRHQEFKSHYDESIGKLDAVLRKVLGSLVPEGGDLYDLALLLRKLAGRPPGVLHGAVPYRSLQLPAVEPVTSPSLTPAYQTSSIVYTSEDLKAVSEAPLSQKITQLAISISQTAGKQNWDPVDLYEWVKNNIRTEWYWGSMKGAEETLRQGSGNDADQAALLIALLRAAGYPSRYVRGVVEFFPDLDAARRLIGIEDAAEIGEFLRKSGVPCQPVIEGSEIINYRVEHIWVETLIPYANYRGSLADMQGPLWLPLDTSFKVAGFVDNGDLDLFSLPGNSLASLRDDYLSEARDLTPIEFLRTGVNALLAANSPGTLYNSVLHQRAQRAENQHIVSALPQFTEIAVTGEYNALPEELVHKVNLVAVGPEPGSEPVLDITLPARELSNQQVQISFEPESVEDQETINSWGGLDNTPSYLVHLRPVLIVNGTRAAVGNQGFPVGGDVSLSVTMTSPSASVTTGNRVIVGYPQLLGIVAQEVVFPELEAGSPTAVDLLHQAGLDYIDRWNQAEKELSELLNIRIARPLPTLVSLGGMLKTTEILGQPQSVEWQGLFIDADLRVVEGASRVAVDDERLLSFMQIAALQGSTLEHQLLEETFQVESISTVKLLGLAQAANLELRTITADNVDIELPQLGLSPVVESDISKAVADGMVVTIPARPLTVQAWQGTGYIKESADTGAAGYMLSGAIAGGNTVLGKEFWPEEIAGTMAKPYRGEANKDALAAHSLTSISPWQVRQATAGEELTAPLMVRVDDETGRPVAGAPVLFAITKGAGTLFDDSVDPALPVQTMTAISGDDGIARARFIPGESVYTNPIVIARPGDDEANIAGENLIAAQLTTGSLAQLADPVIVLGFAGRPDPAQIQVVGDSRVGDVLSYSGDAGVFLYDRFGNPVANHAVQFEVQSPLLAPASPCADSSLETGSSRAEIVAMGDSCLAHLPVHGECSRAATAITLKSRSDGSALVGVVLGGVADALYPVSASLQTTQEQPAEFLLKQYSSGNGACGASALPVEKLVLTYPRLKDAEGRNVDARAAGSHARLNIKSYLLREGAAKQNARETVQCSPEPNLSCAQMTGNGEFTLAAPDQVLGNNLPLQRVATLANSTAMPYLYGLDLTLNEGLNQIPVSAAASYNAAVIENDCSGCGEQVQQQQIVGPKEEVIEIWGVSLQMPDTLIASVDQYGRLVRDTALTYTIQPAEYVAAMAQVLIYADGDLWESILADPSGTAQVSLPAGYVFLSNKSYEIRVLLGNPGDANAIYSEMIPVLPMVSNVDLHVDGLPESVEGQVGAFVLVNNDHDEKDHDPAITSADVETPGMIPEDDELKRAWLHIDDADMLNGTWQVKVSDPSKLRIFYEHAGQLFQVNPDDPPQLITETPLDLPLYLEGLAESSSLQSDTLSLTYTSSIGIQVTDSMPLTVLKFDLAVDGNRDRGIDFGAKADESALFWVNDDHDVEKYSLGDGQNTEDDEENGDDSLDDQISCRRDLEDFARLQIEFGTAVQPGQMSFSAEIIPEYESVQPRMNIFPAVSLTEDYLGFGDDLTASLSQVAKEMLVAVGEEPVRFPSSAIRSDDTTGFLYEGRNNGKGRLVFKANYNGVPVLQKEIDLSLYDITYFYDHFIVEESGLDESPVQPEANPVGDAPKSSREALYQPSSDEYVMFVHGWNMDAWEKKRYAETVFKRLWWQGYQGKVGLFDWPCRTVPSWDLPGNFDSSEYLAWNSGQALQELLKDLNVKASVQVRLLAHSQGNVAAAEAIRLSDKEVIHSYVASQAAMSSSLYESFLSIISPPLDSFTIETPDIFSSYPDGLVNQPFLSSLENKGIELVSYFNVKDYALTGDSTFSPRWEANNRMKPDETLSYGYQGSPDIFPPETPDLGFYQMRPIDDVGVEVYKHQLSFPDNKFEIFSFAAESRARALGAVYALPMFLPESISMDVQGSRDLSVDGFNDKHYSHSRQFRSNIIEEQYYWRSFFVDTALDNSLVTPGG